MDNAEYTRVNSRLFRRLRNYESGGDMEAAGEVENMIARLNMPLVEKVARSMFYKCWAFRGAGEAPPDIDTMRADGMFGLIKAIRSYEDMGFGFHTYAFPKIKREIITGVRFNESFRYLPLSVSPFRDGGKKREELIGDSDSGFDELASRDTANRILGFLSERERSILEMRYRQGKSLPEIGSKLNVSKQAVHKVETRALSKVLHFVREETLAAP